MTKVKIEDEEMNKYLYKLVQDETKIVTYKWLAFNKNIPFAQAKRFLKNYLTNHPEGEFSTFLAEIVFNFILKLYLILF